MTSEANTPGPATHSQATMTPIKSCKNFNRDEDEEGNGNYEEDTGGEVENDADDSMMMLLMMIMAIMVARMGRRIIWMIMMMVVMMMEEEDGDDDDGDDGDDDAEPCAGTRACDTDAGRNHDDDDAAHDGPMNHVRDLRVGSHPMQAIDSSRR